MTDSKAVKGSSKSMLDFYTVDSTSTGHILVIVSGIAAGLVLTVLLVCLLVTCSRKVIVFTIQRRQSFRVMFNLLISAPFSQKCLVNKNSKERPIKKFVKIQNSHFLPTSLRSGIKKQIKNVRILEIMGFMSVFPFSARVT